MMKSPVGAITVALATLLVCCSADPHADQDGVSRSSLNDRFEPSGQGRAAAALGSLRLTRQTHPYSLVAPYVVSRGYPGSGPNLMVNRRNFDEIDQTSMPFPYKRFARLYRNNYIDMPMFHEGKEEKRFHDIPMDEIDLSYFPIGSRR